MSLAARMSWPVFIVVLTAMMMSGWLGEVDAQVQFCCERTGLLPVGAETPTPEGTPQSPVIPTPTPYIFIWPVRHVLSGPANARPGDLVTYRVDYEGIYSKEALAFFDLLWTEGAASFVSIKAVAGPEPKIEWQGERQIVVGFVGGKGPGAVEVTLRIAPDFVGTLRVGIQVRGSSITMPEGSVLSALTTVTPGAEEPSLPGTGDRQRAAESMAIWWAVVGVGGVVAAGAAIVLTASLLRARRRGSSA